MLISDGFVVRPELASLSPSSLDWGILSVPLRYYFCSFLIYKWDVNIYYIGLSLRLNKAFM